MHTLFVVQYGLADSAMPRHTAIYAGGPLVYNDSLLCLQTIQSMAVFMGWKVEVYNLETPNGFPTDGIYGKLIMPEHFDQFLVQRDKVTQENTTEKIRRLWTELGRLLMGENQPQE